MARKSKTTSSPSNQPTDNIPYACTDKSDWAGFINIRLSDQQKLEFSAWWEKNQEAVFGALEELLSEGMKVSSSFDFQHGCFIVSLTGNLLLENPPSRATATSRAPSHVEAQALAVYKHFVVARGNYGNFRPKDSSFLTWG